MKQETEKKNKDSFLKLDKLIMKYVGSDEAIMLATLIEGNKMFESDWFFQTQERLEDITNFNRHKQDKILNNLINIGIIEKKVIGIPPKRFFKIILERVVVLKNQYRDIENKKKEHNKQIKLSKTDKSNCRKLTNQIAENEKIKLLEDDKSYCQDPTNHIVENRQYVYKDYNNKDYNNKDYNNKEKIELIMNSFNEIHKTKRKLKENIFYISKIYNYFNFIELDINKENIDLFFKKAVNYYQGLYNMFVVKNPQTKSYVGVLSTYVGKGKTGFEKLEKIWTHEIEFESSKNARGHY